MNALKQPETWQCAITAFAMVLGQNVEKLIEYVGHDGSDVVYPTLKGSQCRKGHNIHELIPIALACGFAVTPVALYPADKRIVDGESVIYPIMTMVDIGDRLETTLRMTRGVMELYCKGIPHMVAYDRGWICDPATGKAFKYTDCMFALLEWEPVCLWRVDKIRV